MGKRIGLLFSTLGWDVAIWNYRTNSCVERALRREARLWKLKYRDLENRISFTDKLPDLSNSTLIIESVIEDFSIKSKLLNEVSTQDYTKNSVITSNTSSLSINELSKYVHRPERFHGLHFFNPPQKIRFVEISRSSSTSDKTLGFSKRLLDQSDISYCVLPDMPGFIVNNLIFSMINSAISLAEDTNITPEMIDESMKFAVNDAMGPLELADFIGLDTCLSILKNLYARTKDNK